MKRVDHITTAEVVKFREHFGGGQREAAEWAGVSVRQFQRWEAGDSAVPPFIARQMKKRLAQPRRAR